MRWLLTSRKLPLLFVEGFPFGRCDGDTVGFVTGGNRCWKFSSEKKISTKFWLTVLGSKVALSRSFKTPCLSQQPQGFLRQVMFPLCLFNVHQSPSPLRANPDATQPGFAESLLPLTHSCLLSYSSPALIFSFCFSWVCPTCLEYAFSTHRFSYIVKSLIICSPPPLTASLCC